MPKRSPLHRAPRYPIVFPVSYRPERGASGPARTGRTCNLSIAGACLELGERLSPGTCISLTVETEEERFTLVADVVWVDHFVSTGGDLRHGVKFMRLTLDQQQALRDALRRHARVWSPSRVQLTLPARCLPSALQGSALAGWTADLGREGLALDLPQRLPIGTSVAITLAAPRGEVTSTATIVWVESCDPVPVGRCLRHGLVLTNPGSMWDRLGGFRSGESSSLGSEGAGSPAAAA